MAKTKKTIKGKDKDANGNFTDPRKSKLFFTPKKDLQTKTQLEGIRSTVFVDRYSLKDDEGKPLEEYPEQMWSRVAKGVAQFEKGKKLQRYWEEKFYEVMNDFKFVPAGRILSGAGTGYEVTFFNCYVIPSPHDSRGGIMENITQTVEIQSRAGGVGVNLSTLRPRGARVRKVNGTSSGAVNWAELYSTANHQVIQQGGSRRGALMLMLADWHPDIEEFITVKKDLTRIPGANLSVTVSDDFMKAVANDENWDLIFPDYQNEPDYDEFWDGDIQKWKESGRKVKVYKTLKAREIWDMIAESAWNCAEPGLHFIDRSNNRGNTWYFEKLIATNPCGEQPLGAWAVCNLGAMNLSAYVDQNGEFDYDSLAEDSRIAMRFMDNVVEANFYFYSETYDKQMDIRRTGLGTMGLADALIKMKVRYGSAQSEEIIEKIYKTIRDNAYIASAHLAKEKGTFKKFDKEKYLQGWFIKRLPEGIRELISENGIRNAVLLTQAPTGTTSLLAGVSSGIEPVFSFEYKRTDRTGEHIVYHPIYGEWKEKHPDETKAPDYFVSAMDLTPEEHLLVQAKVQEYTDSSISKTVNAPNDYTVEDVKRLYTKAYESGCKGITFFRDGSRTGVLEAVKKDDKDKKEEEKHPQMPLPMSPESGTYLVNRPFAVRGATYKMQTPVGTAFITINHDDAGEPLELFVNVGKAGSDVSAMAEALGRTISTALRLRGGLNSRDKAKEIAEQLQGIGGRRSVGFGQNKILSLPDAISVALSAHFGFRNVGPAYSNGNGHAHLNNGLSHSVDDMAVQSQSLFMAVNQNPDKLIDEGNLLTKDSNGITSEGKQKADICPECGSSTLILEEGCAKCYTCGHSEC